jgi:hypothetical protein
MHITPKLEHKLLNECAPGELVRLSWGDEPLAFVAKHDDKFFEILLEGDQGEKTPCFYTSDTDDHPVLSYGGDFEFEISQTGPREIHTSRLYERNGAILIGQSIFMRVAPARGLFHYSPIYVDLKSGMITGIPRTDFSTFIHWEISIPGATPDRRISLLKFQPKLD